MPIRWSAAAVSKALDEVEQALAQAEPFLDQADAALEKAQSVPNLPEYMRGKLLFVERKLSQLTGVRRTVQDARKDIPQTEQVKGAPLV